MTDAKNDEQNSVQPENEKALAENATDTISQVVEGAAQLAEKARKSGERYVEEGRRLFPEAEEYYRQGREVLSSQVQAGPCWPSWWPERWVIFSPTSFTAAARLTAAAQTTPPSGGPDQMKPNATACSKTLGSEPRHFAI